MWSEIKNNTIMDNNTAKAGQVRIKKVVSWTIPFFGNNHTMPYGKLLVTDGETEKIVSTKGDTLESYERYFCQYITFKRKPYEVVMFWDEEKKVKRLRLEPIEDAIVKRLKNK